MNRRTCENKHVNYRNNTTRGGSVAEWLRRKTPTRATRDHFPVPVACTIRKFVMLGERKPHSLDQTMCAKIYNAAELE